MHNESVATCYRFLYTKGGIMLFMFILLSIIEMPISSMEGPYIKMCRYTIVSSFRVPV